MKDNANLEIKIAIIVAIIMATVILIAVIFTKQETATNTVDLHVYKLYSVEGSEDEHVYRECNITTDDVIKLYAEYRKIKKLPDSYKLTGKTINGDYKIISGNEFIAFDKGGSRVYRSDTTAIYAFNSTIYQNAVDMCTQSEENAAQSAAAENAAKENEVIEKEVKK